MTDFTERSLSYFTGLAADARIVSAQLQHRTATALYGLRVLVYVS